ncbi:hypothetical protein FOXYSP1_18214 [Fusarium oxysporum f. sp. phaseoli]
MPGAVPQAQPSLPVCATTQLHQHHRTAIPTPRDPQPTLLNSPNSTKTPHRCPSRAAPSASCDTVGPPPGPKKWLNFLAL